MRKREHDKTNGRDRALPVDQKDNGIIPYSRRKGRFHGNTI